MCSVAAVLRRPAALTGRLLRPGFCSCATPTGCWHWPRTRGCAAPFLYTLPPLPFPEPTIVTRKVLGLSGLTMSNVALGRIRLLQGQAAGVTD